MSDTSKVLVWDADGKRFFEAGVKKAVLYPMNSNGAYPKGVAWNGLTKITESPSGAEETKLYANDSKYGSLLSNEEFGATIEAYTYPEEFEACDGSAELATGVLVTMQDRKAFGLSYVTTIANDSQGLSCGEKIHIIYNAKAKPSSKDRSTIGENVEANTMSWEITTTPVDVPGMKKSAHIIIDSRTVSPNALAAIKAALYGSDEGSGSDPYLPSPTALLALITANPASPT